MSQHGGYSYTSEGNVQLNMDVGTRPKTMYPKISLYQVFMLLT